MIILPRCALFQQILRACLFWWTFVLAVQNSLLAVSDQDRGTSTHSGYSTSCRDFRPYH